MTKTLYFQKDDDFLVYRIPHKPFSIEYWDSIDSKWSTSLIFLDSNNLDDINKTVSRLKGHLAFITKKEALQKIHLLEMLEELEK